MVIVRHSSQLSLVNCHPTDGTHTMPLYSPSARMPPSTRRMIHHPSMPFPFWSVGWSLSLML